MTDEATPGAAARRRRPGYDQATVLRRAVELFNRQGYDGTSMGDLAADLGLSKSAIYHHVPSKEHLLAQALDEALARLTAIVADAAYGRGSAVERLRTVVHRSVVVLVAHQPAVTLLLRVHGNSEVELDALRRRRWIDTQLAALVRAAVDEGALRTDVDPDLASRLLFGMVHSLVGWYGADQGPDPAPDVEAVAAAISAIAFDGLLRPPD